MECRPGGVVGSRLAATGGRTLTNTQIASAAGPYLRYYSSPGPTNDLGYQPTVLVVFGDEIAQTHFLPVARQEMTCWR